MLSSRLSPQVVSRAAAAEEVLRRRKARSSLAHFTKFTFPQYRAEPAHELIASTLDRLIRGTISRLMILAPPQHGKSELVSVRLPAFWLGQRPDDPVILASYGADLAYDKSRQARGIVESDDYRALFPGVRSRRDSRAVNHWTLAGRRGGMLAAGVGGPITGHGARLGIIDDPFENWEQAQSQTYRDRAWDWYRATFRPRVWEGGAIVLICTRWHEDDLAGRILQDQAERWTVLRLPALAETQEERDENNRRMGLAQGLPDPLGRAPGEALCPLRFSREALLALCRDVGSLVWAGEYQGAPRAPEGNRFKRDWFPIQDAAPAQVLARIRYWDKAATKGGGAFTAGVRMSITAMGLLIVEDVVRGQWSSFERDEVMKQTAKLDGHEVLIFIEQEPGSSGVDSVKAEIRTLVGYATLPDPPTGNKDVRLEPFVAQAEAGNVRLLRGPWNMAYIEELCAVPNGKYRDQADASAGGLNRLAELIDTPAQGVVTYEERVEISPV